MFSSTMLFQRNSLEMMVLELLRTPHYSIATYDVKAGSLMVLGELQQRQRLRELFSYLQSYGAVALDMEQRYQPGMDAFFRWDVEDHLEELFAQDEMYKPLLLRAGERKMLVYAVEYPQKDMQTIALRAKMLQGLVEGILEKNPISYREIYPQIAAIVLEEMKQFPQLQVMRRLRHIPEKARDSLLIECPAAAVPWVLAGLLDDARKV